MRIAVIDGQGGGVGRALISELSGKLSAKDSLIALGTNAIATSAMMKAGAPEGATGENAIVYNAARADVILGPVPQKKLVTPEEIGYLTAFLCSDAARGITAQAYTIDGGWIQM
jgi:NAD(P)-dependent dehydrogenase (short-subunit alcohol dehydrogenase family)